MEKVFSQAHYQGLRRQLTTSLHLLKVHTFADIYLVLRIILALLYVNVLRILKSKKYLEI